VREDNTCVVGRSNGLPHDDLDILLATVVPGDDEAVAGVNQHAGIRTAQEPGGGRWKSMTTTSELTGANNVRELVRKIFQW
jgi:hypothetical protein